MSSNYVGKNFWDDPDFKSGDFFSFDKDGDTVTGVYTSWGKKVWEPKEGETRGNVSLLLYVTTDAGADLEITAPADLKKKWQAAAPNPGDRVKITQIGSTKVAVGTQRFFSVDVQRKTNSTAINNPKSTAPIPTTAVDEENIPF